MKKKIIEELLKKLNSELETISSAAKAAHDAASHEDNKSENRQDTRATLDGYLAGAQSKIVINLEKQIELLRKYEIVRFSKKDLIAPGAIVRLIDNNNLSKTYFLLSNIGGYTFQIENILVYVISKQSPIGEMLCDQAVGDVIEVETHNGLQEYEVESVE